ncbi:MAG: N-methylhydantoinase [Chloroflexota bacterium]|nr:N-methylhydantoinase [Chloroflexota bacterium]
MTSDAGAGSWAVGIDVGGTFTDAVAIHADGATRLAKVPSTPDDPARALIAALDALARDGVEPAAIGRLVHGTTIATNALLAGSLARVVLVTTAGFRDVLGIRAGMRAAMYDLFAARPAELVRRVDRLEVHERMAPEGRPSVPLTYAEIGRVVAAVRRRRPRSIAIALLFSYASDAHERRLATALRKAFPGVPVTCSSDVSREFREYPRTATAAVAAGLRPAVERYLGRAEARARGLGVRVPLLVMESSGGVLTAARAGREPHRLVLSGPAAGVGGAIELAGRLGIRACLTVDIGGTSVDVALVRNGRAATVPIQHHQGTPLVAPAVDIATAGAGGGSIAWLDPAGALLVGPASAGADPGPACYGAGGRLPTVTDAHVVAGSLGETTALAGTLRLDRARAVEAIATLAGPLGLPVDAAAEGILAIATANVAAVIRRVSVERGVDPRELPLVVFGGAGPLHAGRLVRELGLVEAIVPPTPGLLSAAGLVGADLRLDDALTVLVRLDAADPRALVAWYREASAALRRQLLDDGVPRAAQHVSGSVDCRYVGQGYEIGVPLETIDARGIRAATEAFHREHAARYGHRSTDPVEAVTLRVSVVGRLSHPAVAAIDPRRRAAPPAEARLVARSLVLPGSTERLAAGVWRRDRLRPGDRIAGPAIVEQLDATTVVLPRQVATVGPFAELHLRGDRR